MPEISPDQPIIQGRRFFFRGFRHVPEDSRHPDPDREISNNFRGNRGQGPACIFFRVGLPAVLAPVCDLSVGQSKGGVDLDVIEPVHEGRI